MTLFYLLNGDHDHSSMGPIVAASSVMALVAAPSMIASMKIKSRILKTKMENGNLISAFKPDTNKDYESGVAGTSIHNQSTNDMTKLAFMCLAAFYALAFTLEFAFCLSKASKLVQCLSCVVFIAFSTFMFIFCGMTCIMNMNMASCVRDQINKSNQAS